MIIKSIAINHNSNAAGGGKAGNTDTRQSIFHPHLETFFESCIRLTTASWVGTKWQLWPSLESTINWFLCPSRSQSPHARTQISHRRFREWLWEQSWWLAEGMLLAVPSWSKRQSRGYWRVPSRSLHWSTRRTGSKTHFRSLCRWERKHHRKSCGN